MHRCEFWGPVIGSVQQRFDLNDENLVTHVMNAKRADFFSHISGRIRRKKMLQTASLNELYVSVAKNNFALMDEVVRRLNVKGIIDSSKTAHTLACYLAHKPQDWNIKIIHLVRDARATAFSMRQGSLKSGLPVLSFGRYLYGWRHQNRLLSLLGKTLPVENYMTINFEDLCSASENYLESLDTFLGNSCDPEKLLYSVSQRHDLAGSPSMYDNNEERIKLKLDLSWQTRMTSFQKLMFKVIASRCRW